MKRSLNYLLVIVPVLVLVGVGCEATRAGYESAPYKAVRTNGAYELREYPALVIAETPMAKDGKDDNGSFGRLFRFISGQNGAEEKIAMTTPVFMGGGDDAKTMSFVMPADMKAGDVPQPRDGAVKVRVVEQGEFAVLRFSGGRSAAREEEELGKLKAWVAKEGFDAMSGPVYAYFDPPWTPSFLRRNEVMLRLEKE